MKDWVLYLIKTFQSSKLYLLVIYFLTPSCNQMLYPEDFTFTKFQNPHKYYTREQMH